MNWLSKLFDFSPDPVKRCIIYKKYGCAHVDGMLCNYNHCQERKEAEVDEIDKQLRIAHLKNSSLKLKKK